MVATIEGERLVLGGTATRVARDKADWRKDVVGGAVMMSLGSGEELGAHHVDGLPSRGHVNCGRLSLLGGGTKKIKRIKAYLNLIGV
jgi:hypothetical protein